MANKFVLTNIEINNFSKKNFELIFFTISNFFIDCKLHCVLQEMLSSRYQFCLAKQFFLPTIYTYKENGKVWAKSLYFMMILNFQTATKKV